MPSKLSDVLAYNANSFLWMFVAVLRMLCTSIWLSYAARPVALLRIYGWKGLILHMFGSSSVWRLRANVLGTLEFEQAMSFKKSVQDECTMTAVAAAIIAQIAITGYTLDGIADTHWVSRACMLFSLTAALMAVFYATTQQKILGRLATPKHIRSWIRGTIMTSDIDDPEEQLELCNAGGYPSEIITALQDMNRKATEIPDFGGGREVLRCIEALSGRHAEAIIAQCFTPSVASVITISAPQMLLSVSLLNLLLAVGVYIGFVWRSGLGSDLNSNDARNIFIVYIVSLGACSAVYSVSRLVTEDRRTPENIVLQLHYLAHVKKTIDAQSHRTQPDQATNRTSTQVTDRTTTIPEGAAHVT